MQARESAGFVAVQRLSEDAVLPSLDWHVKVVSCVPPPQPTEHAPQLVTSQENDGHYQVHEKKRKKRKNEIVSTNANENVLEK